MEMEGKWFENWSNLLSFENLFAGVAFFFLKNAAGEEHLVCLHQLKD